MGGLRRSAEVSDAGFEDRLMLVARNVFGDLFAGAFRVGHFSEDSATGRGDAFDGEGRAVRVDGIAYRWISIRIAILRGDLAVCGELPDG